MLFLLLAAMLAEVAPSATGPRTAVDAERAFAADAQALGQWTAFRKWAADDATMFLPQPANAQAAMKDWRDPARAIAWSPTASFVSCDGKVAANTGEWRRPDGSVGFFSTVWVRQVDGSWKWTVDGGDQLTVARARVLAPAMRRATCGPPVGDLPMRPPADLRALAGGGVAPDRSLAWGWAVRPDGARIFTAWLWSKRRWERVINDHIAAPPRNPATP